MDVVSPKLKNNKIASFSYKTILSRLFRGHHHAQIVRATDKSNSHIVQIYLMYTTFKYSYCRLWNKSIYVKCDLISYPLPHIALRSMNIEKHPVFQFQESWKEINKL